MSDESDDGEPAELPIDGELDLHTFRPDEVAELVGDYLDECRRRGIFEIRIVHGKGTGVLKRVVWEWLRGHPYVEDFRLGETGEGGGGVTVVRLKE